MKMVSLFSGIGGFEEAGEQLGWETIAFCEWNSFGQTVISHHHPKAVKHEDIKTTDFTVYRGKCDIVTGGLPCQPYSIAGQRKGKDDERHLWPEMLRAIREIQPSWVVGENVLGLINWSNGLVFHEVQADLEAAGYEVFPYVLPACGVNAPHERYRIWFVAHAISDGYGNELREGRPAEEKEQREKQWQERNEIQRYTKRTDVKRDASDTDDSFGWSVRGHEACERGKNEKLSVNSNIRRNGITPNTNGIGLRGEDNGIRKSEFANQIRSTNYWQNFPTQSPVRTGNDGFSSELLRQRIREDSMGYLSEKEIDKIISKAHAEWTKETIKAAGNAVVWQVVLQIFKSIQEYELQVVK